MAEKIVTKAIRLLKAIADREDNSDLTDDERTAVGWALSYAVEYCPTVSEEDKLLYLGESANGSTDKEGDIVNAVNLREVYTNKELSKLLRLYKDIEGQIAYNPFYYCAQKVSDFAWDKFQEHYEDFCNSRVNRQVAKLIDGTTPFNELPLLVNAVNEEWRGLIKWRLDIGK